MAWRVGHKVLVNVYDGDRPVCQCHDARDAALIVFAVNRLYQEYAGPLTEADIQSARKLLKEHPEYGTGD